MHNTVQKIISYTENLLDSEIIIKDQDIHDASLQIGLEIFSNTENLLDSLLDKDVHDPLILSKCGDFVNGNLRW